MNIALPTELVDSLKVLVDQGRFASEEQACVAGVELLVSRERLKMAVDRGRDQISNGQWSDEDTVFTEIEAEIVRDQTEHQSGA